MPYVPSVDGPIPLTRRGLCAPGGQTHVSALSKGVSMSTSRLKRASLFLSLVVAVGWSSSIRADDGHGPGQKRATWAGTWATGPAGSVGAAPEFANQTLRQIVHTSAGGDRVRIRVSNTFGTSPVVVGSAHVALRSSGSSIVPGTDRALSFGGKPSITLPAGALVLSDPVSLEVPALADLAVSIYLPVAAVADTNHALALQTSYIASGDVTGAASLPGAATTTSWYFLTGVDVSRGHRGGASVVCLGNSITDGANSTTDANGRWPDVLARRLQARHELSRIGVLNEGIIGNRILHPTEPAFGNLFGPAGLARFDRDVLAQAGVRYLIVLLGINDIGHPGSAAPLTDEVSAEEIEAGLTQFVARAHEKGIKVMGATLTPFEGTTIAGFYSPEKELKRQAVNQWIRTSHVYDAVVDFDAAVRDPTHPARMLPAYDGGDHLHPSDLGHQAMGNAVPLGFFEDEGDD
jgi:lysophospholipase L1-like esterase